MLRQALEGCQGKETSRDVEIAAQIRKALRTHLSDSVEMLKRPEMARVKKFAASPVCLLCVARCTNFVPKAKGVTDVTDVRTLCGR